MMMKIAEALTNNEAEILSLWTERALDTYVSSEFFKKSLDRFANPVGSNIREALSHIFRLLRADARPEELSKPLDLFIRIRAVQDFTPAQAIAPLLDLKWVVRQIFSKEEAYQHLIPELLPFDRDVDRIILQAFDLYVTCREQLYKARIRELKSGSYILTDSACAAAVVRENQQEVDRITKNTCFADKA
jgi:hypothetical protein